MLAAGNVVRVSSTNERSLSERVAETMRARDAVLDFLGMEVVTVGPGSATVRLRANERMANGHAIVHGGIIFTLADTAFAYACNSGNAVTVAAHCSITFVAPARPGDLLEAVAEERCLHGRSGVYDATVRNVETGQTVALFRGNSRRIGDAIVDEQKLSG